MAGVSLKDLPFDILVLIVSFFQTPGTRNWLIDSPLIARLGTPPSLTDPSRELSLVCRAFNEACSVFLFRRYHVALDKRITLRNGVDVREPKACISVITRKAPHIRELVIDVDDNVEEEVIQDLVSAVRCATGIIGLKLCSRGSERQLSKELIEALASRVIKPKTLIFVGEWSPPGGAETIDKIEELHITPMSSGNLALTTFIKAAKVHLSHCLWDGADIAPYKPTKYDSHLKFISVVFSDAWDTFLFSDAWDTFLRQPEEKHINLFDFSRIPLADVEVRLENIHIYYWTWMKRRDAVSNMFADNLRTFNVRLDENEGSVSIWRTKGEEVIYQDHLADDERDAEGLAYDQQLREDEARPLLF